MCVYSVLMCIVLVCGCLVLLLCMFSVVSVVGMLMWFICECVVCFVDEYDNVVI